VTLHYLNTTLTGLFTLECVMKIFSFGFRVKRNQLKVVLGTDKNGLTCLDETGWINLIG
jgi:hypothetical protein